jgi:hypothetical protein
MEVKLVSVCAWPTPLTVFDFCFFLGLCSFYWCYVWNFAKIAGLSHDLATGGVTKRLPIWWLLLHQAAFQCLKDALTSALVLLLPNPLKKLVMETYVLDFAVGAVLLQEGKDSFLHLVAFESCKLNKS